MEKTRAGENSSLNRWNVHRAELTDMSLKNINDSDVEKAFRDWVVKGENSPSYGDNLYDLLLCKIVPSLKINNMFFFKTVKAEEKYIIYGACILRRKIGNMPPMTSLTHIYLYTDTLEMDMGNGSRIKLGYV